MILKKRSLIRTHLISQLQKEQKLVKPTLQRSYDIASQLTRLKAERARLLATWRAIQQKGGRTRHIGQPRRDGQDPPIHIERTIG